MTKESKIGLLVGLAFVLAVGILLSDHLSTTNEPTPAPLQSAGGAVRSSLDATTATVAEATAVRVPRTIAPSQPVTTAGELAANRRRRTATPVAASLETDLPPTAMATGPEAGPSVVPPSANPALIAAATQRGEPLVPAERPTTIRTVVAEPGDTLGDLVERAYGTNTRSTREAMLSANPALRADPGKIVAGRAYPVAAAKGSATATAAAEPAVATAGTVLYTVQAGDNLWSIAATQVGTTRAVAGIRELNRDVLQGDRVHPGVKLRLPRRATPTAG